MRKPTRTINRLHFEDLGPRRFDDLVLALVYRSRKWEGIHHDGRMGGDEGVDIRAIEREMDGHWFVRPIAIRRSEPRLPGFYREIDGHMEFKLEDQFSFANRVSPDSAPRL